MNIYDELLVAALDEHNASLLYERLSAELEKRRLHRAAAQLMAMSRDEKRHHDTVEGILQELRVIGGLVGAAAPGSSLYWWVRFPDAAKYEKFDTRLEAMKYVKDVTGEEPTKAKWISPYAFELGPWKSPNHINLFEGDEDGQPTGRHLYGKVS